jgi:putative tryptophan/tyrosine transport system substrate-binding protein
MMRRREFIAGLGSAAAAWPIGVCAQDTAIPVVGVITPFANVATSPLYRLLREGLKHAGYVEGQNVIVEYRWEATDFARQQELATDLVRRHVTVILAQATGPALAAKRATSTIPIVFFGIGGDPVEFGLVASINRPGANVTGVGFDDPSVKRLDLLCQVVPASTTIAYLSGGPGFLAFKAERPQLMAAAIALGRQFVEVECPSKDKLQKSFESIIENGAGAVFVSGIPLFGNNMDEVISLAALHKIPAMYPGRLFTARGGLMSYAEDRLENLNIAVGLVGNILKGAKPADLPVRNSTKFEFVLNLKTARALGLTIPETLLAIADEVIE